MSEAAKSKPPVDSPFEDDFAPQRASAQLMAARIALRKTELEKAREILKGVFNEMPTDREALELLGDLFMAEGEQEKALKVFERGLKYHPQHKSFEEKIAVCHIDIDTMQREKEMRDLVMEKGDTEQWMDRKPQVAMSLSLMFPGAGQLYNGEPARAGVFLGIMLVCFSAWFIPLANALPKATSKTGLDLSAAIDSMSGGGRSWFWFMLIAWLINQSVSAVDAWIEANRVNLQRKKFLGIE